MGRIHLIFLVSLLIGAFEAVPALAGVWIQATGMASSQVSTRSFYTATAAYAFLQGFEIGAEAIQLKNSTQDTGLAYGPKVGLFIGGFEASAAYLLSSTRNFNGDEYTGGGYALNLGYSPYIFRPVRAGVMFTDTEFLLNKKNGSTLTPAMKLTAWSPMFAIGIDF